MTTLRDSGAVDEVDVQSAWERLSSDPKALLVDVRTKAEWAFVGIPDLAPVGKRPLLMEWQTFPDQCVDRRFAERLEGELAELDADRDTHMFFICRSGSRSLAAAQAMAAMGFRACHNVAGGFEGSLDPDRHRSNVEGWKASGLPWIQS